MVAGESAEKYITSKLLLSNILFVFLNRNDIVPTILGLLGSPKIAEVGEELLKALGRLLHFLALDTVASIVDLIPTVLSQAKAFIPEYAPLGRIFVIRDVSKGESKGISEASFSDAADLYRYPSEERVNELAQEGTIYHNISRYHRFIVDFYQLTSEKHTSEPPPFHPRMTKGTVQCYGGDQIQAYLRGENLLFVKAVQFENRDLVVVSSPESSLIKLLGPKERFPSPPRSGQNTEATIKIYSAIHQPIAFRVKVEFLDEIKNLRKFEDMCPEELIHLSYLYCLLEKRSDNQDSSLSQLLFDFEESSPWETLLLALAPNRGI